MKKILAVVLVLAMACGVIPCSFAEEAVALPAVGDTVEAEKWRLHSGEYWPFRSSPP